MLHHYKGLLLLMVVTTLAACRVTHTYKQPEGPAANLYRDQTVTDTVTLASRPWQSLFADTLLQHLITTGLRENLDLKIAITRIDAAKAALRSSKAAFWPDINGNAGIKQSRFATAQSFGLFENATQYDIGLTAGWEADIWGKIRSAKRAALAGLLQSEAARRAVQTQLVADIANNYYTLLALDEQLAVLEKTLINRQADVTAMKELKAANVVNGAAVVQSEANQYAAAVAIPDMKKQIRETENALGILLAQPSGMIRRAVLAEQSLPATLHTGVPAQLLQYRPDVQQAEYAFRVAFENTNVARTYFYPSLNITAAGGFSTFNFKDWFSSLGLFGNIAAGVTQPIFNKGLNKARLATARAKQEEAGYRFRQSLLTAGEEVSNALYAYETAKEKQRSRVMQLQALEKSVDFTKELLRYSTATNYTDVLTSEQSLLAARIGDITDRLQQWQAVIVLYRSLGGGWQ
ncbi:efflux transporter outer membrane subunit [Chitinophaga nivalis]|uniref:Efflux transporter outer membrane subunit n=1 Tax=Chitinophaga nivalis TaxID=2991709 RepID=A0ABT3ISB4_9BACT|nr:efflux transporter outer membrane subunit [Chitinophaga nivalis]MCW3463440.1 efflux transporter outer membrane subunit [Chitinophaga nivalis]MCW3486870.1 efflux transporter outer membrane subunit [Chitinophaga nivalis]